MSILDDAREALEAAQERERRVRAISEVFSERLEAAERAVERARETVRKLDEAERRCDPDR